MVTVCPSCGHAGQGWGGGQMGVVTQDAPRQGTLCWSHQHHSSHPPDRFCPRPFTLAFIEHLLCMPGCSAVNGGH